MEPVEIVPGLWRWSAAHREWKPEDDWGQMVGCVLYELGGDRAALARAIAEARAPAGP